MGAAGISLPNFKLCYKAAVIKTIWHWHKNRAKDRWNGIETPDSNPNVYGQLIYNKGAMDVQWGNDRLFNRWCWQNWTATCKRMELGHCLTPYPKVNSKWIKVLHASHESIKVSEKHIGRNLMDTNVSDFFTNISPRARPTNQSRNEQVGLFQAEELLHSKGHHQHRSQPYPTVGENVFINDSSKKGLTSKTI